MKRSTPCRRGLTEQRNDSRRHYGCYIRDSKKEQSKINPVFTGRPHYGIPEVKPREEEE